MEEVRVYRVWIQKEQVVGVFVAGRTYETFRGGLGPSPRPSIKKRPDSGGTRKKGHSAAREQRGQRRKRGSEKEEDGNSKTGKPTTRSKWRNGVLKMSRAIHEELRRGET